MSVKRLTEKHYKSSDGYYMKCSEHCENSAIQCGECDEVGGIIDRLGTIEDILGDDYDLDRLRELVEADREGRCAVMPFIPGSEVWVIERDENGDPDCVSGFVFIASVNNAAFVHPYIAGNGGIEVILQDLLENTAEWQDCDIETYPVEDCYESYEAASIAMEGE